MNTAQRDSRSGLLFGLAAYGLWSVLPLYFSAVTPFVSPLELLAHRVVWGLLFLGLVMTVTGRWGQVLAALRDRRTAGLLVLSAVLVATNWFVFLYGVWAGRVVETSLGYCVTPLVSIILGVLVFRERLRPARCVALALVAAGIGYLVLALGQVPWVALTIALSFGLYGMVRKLTPVDGLVGLVVETLLLAPAAAGFLLTQTARGEGVLVAGSAGPMALLVFSGALTAVPFICFGEAARRLRLSTLGFLQYLLPTLQLLQAVTLLGEPFRLEQLVSFALVWAAMALVTADSVLSRDGSSPAPAPARKPRPAVGAVRADWRARLPGWLQPFLTWLIAYPHAGQKPLFPNRPWWLAALTPAAVLALGLALAAGVVHVGGFAWLALPVAWLLVVHGGRALHVLVIHQGVHGNLTGSPVKDRVVVEAVSTLLLVQGHDGYKHDHDAVHHPRLASAEDPDRQFTLEVMRIAPGADRAANKRRFLAALLSPRVHARFLAGRFRANFVDCPPLRRLLACAWLGVVAAALVASQRWVEFLVGCVVPLGVLFHMSSMCQFVTEHFWVRRRQPGQSARDHNLALLVNRHLGDPLPPVGLTGLAWWSGWAAWWSRLLLYHVPVRLGILAADLPVHGSHHLWPHEKRWADGIYRFRELSEQTGKSPTEFVGSYGELLDYMMEDFGEAPPAPLERALTPRVVRQAVQITQEV
jgi:chloramphenicol-sensitive protein RarD